MPLSETWRDQYDRMLRSHQALIAAAGPSTIGSDAARDILYHFFQDAFHLRDWLFNSDDPTVATKAGVLKGPNNHIKATPALALCADLCNGMKHFALERTASGDKSTTVATQHATINVMSVHATAFVYSGTPAEPTPQPGKTTAEHRWTVTSNGQTRDALNLANEVVAEWEQWLTTESLLP